MVYRKGEKSMEKLHNFPMNFNWGTQVILKCKKINSNGGEAAPAPTGDRNLAVERRLPEFERGGSYDHVKVSSSPVRVEAESSGERLRCDGIEALRKEIMCDLHSKADKIKDVLREGLIGEIPSSSSPAKSPSPPMDGGATNPCNFRTRRAACRRGGGNVDGGRSLNVDVLRKPNNLSSTRNESKSPEDSGGNACPAKSCQKRERAKFSCSLSLSEIEKDFLAMTGQRLPRRPKKRPRAVQKKLENLYPAMLLREVHPDDYKVPEAPENGKR